MKSLPRLMMSALALAAATLAAPAHAVGRLVDVDVIDRDTGAQLPVYQHRGEWWIAARPGARYAIQVRNAAPGRVLGVMAVDGVNVISGDTASWEQTGYVLSRGQSAQITGWRKSDAEVAAFHFTALPNSYAARTGRPDSVPPPIAVPPVWVLVPLSVKVPVPALTSRPLPSIEPPKVVSTWPSAVKRASATWL